MPLDQKVVTSQFCDRLDHLKDSRWLILPNQTRSLPCCHYLLCLNVLLNLLLNFSITCSIKKLAVPLSRRVWFLNFRLSWFRLFRLFRLDPKNFPLSYRYVLYLPDFRLKKLHQQGQLIVHLVYDLKSRFQHVFFREVPQTCMRFPCNSLVDFIIRLMKVSSYFRSRLSEAMVFFDLGLVNDFCLTKRRVFLDDEQAQTFDTLEGIKCLSELDQSPIADELDQSFATG